MRRTILITYLLMITIFTFAQDSSHKMNIEIQSLNQIHEDIKEIRRDQLNYKIEKDLLREAYSSNYSTIQIVISLILAVFAILGYIGFKGIIDLRKQYDLELTKIKDLKSSFEKELKSLQDSQEKVNTQIKSIDTLNSEQSKKIKILEIKDKINSLYINKGYQRVLEYIAVGIELSPEDQELLTYKAITQLKLKNFPEATEAHKKILQIDPTNQSIICNLAELYLLIGNISVYNEFIKDKIAFVKSHSIGLSHYLEALKNYIEKNTSELRKVILDFVNTNDLVINKNYTSDWDFAELNFLLNCNPNTPEKNLLINFTQYLTGGMQGQQIINLLQ